jgi:hypothetical protein
LISNDPNLESYISLNNSFTFNGETVLGLCDPPSCDELNELVKFDKKEPEEDDDEDDEEPDDEEPKREEDPKMDPENVDLMASFKNRLKEYDDDDFDDEEDEDATGIGEAFGDIVFLFMCCCSCNCCW